MRVLYAGSLLATDPTLRLPKEIWLSGIVMALKRGIRRRIQKSSARSEVSANEKRVFSRVECLLDLELQHGLTEDVEALDLSLQGLGFQRDLHKGPLPLGKTVTVGIHGFPPVVAQVRWNEGSRVGVQFCGQLHDILDSWVGEVLAAQGIRIGDLIETFRN